MMKSKRGSTMVEAAVVFPMVILSVVSVVYMMIGMFQVTRECAMFHTYLLSQAGEVTETFRIYPESSREYSADEKNSRITAEYDVEMKGGAMIRKGSFELSGEAACVDEEEYIRKCDYAAGQ